MTDIFSRKVFFILFVFIINACGYELRTQSEVLSNKLIDFIATDSELNLELERQLNLLNNNLEPKDSKYDLALQIREHKIEKFVGSIGSGARTTQVRLDYSIVYEVTKKNSKMFINQFNNSKFIDFNQSNIFSKLMLLLDALVAVSPHQNKSCLSICSTKFTDVFDGS